MHPFVEHDSITPLTHIEKQWPSEKLSDIGLRLAGKKLKDHSLAHDLNYSMVKWEHLREALHECISERRPVIVENLVRLADAFGIFFVLDILHVPFLKNSS